MEDDGQLEALLATLDSAVTADKRVAALQSLQACIAQADDISLPEQLTAALKTQLKNQNHLVSSLALSIIPVYTTKLSLSIHHSKAHDVKSLLLAVLTPVLERLGDQKEKIRDAARSAAVQLARAAYSVSPSSAKDMHSAASSFEKLYKETGLAAKSAKVKEQVSLTGWGKAHR